MPHPTDIPRRRNRPRLLLLDTFFGVPWMNRDGIRECIPPACTRWLGDHAPTTLTASPLAVVA
ncbi:hypothetical protein ACFW2Y_16850 [Streptomyces sp. NPDC058877]|uniref:hypothetical protein n=1 Tax=Streptomyces sp. NPDC058877 TaxID=3346665 RepID=UPI00367A47A0